MTTTGDLSNEVINHDNRVYALVRRLGRDDLAERIRVQAARWSLDHTAVVLAGDVKRGKTTGQLGRELATSGESAGKRLAELVDAPVLPVSARPGHFTWTSPLGRAYRTRGEPISPPAPEPAPDDDP